MSNISLFKLLLTFIVSSSSQQLKSKKYYYCLFISFAYFRNRFAYLYCSYEKDSTRPTIYDFSSTQLNLQSVLFPVDCKRGLITVCSLWWAINANFKVFTSRNSPRRQNYLWWSTRLKFAWIFMTFNCSLMHFKWRVSITTFRNFVKLIHQISFGS